MNNGMIDYNQITPEIATSSLTDTRRDMGYVYDSLNGFIGDMDPRIKEYYQSMYDNLNNQMQELNESDIIIRDAGRRFNNTYDQYRNTKQAAADVNSGTQLALGNTNPGAMVQTAAELIGDKVARGLVTLFNPDKKTLKIDKHKWNEQSPETQQNIINKLKEHGFSENEITDIINGNIVVDQSTFEQLQAQLSSAIEHNPATVVKLEEVLGFPILDENNKVDNNRLKLAMLVAGKNLGMDVDMSAGSAFKKDINSITVDLQSAYRKDPSIRDKVVDTYGIDIFDIDGKVDQEKLALVRVIDGINPKDEYDINKLLGKDTVDPVIDQAIKTPVTTPVGSNDVDNPDGNDVNNGGSKEVEVGPEVVKPTDTVTPGIGEDDLTSKKTESIKTSVRDGFGSVGNGILDAIEKGASRIAKGVSPYSGNASATRGMNKATAGIIAAASVAAGGVAAGGGLLVGKKLNVIHFTPADWIALGVDYQSVIEALMRKVGFSTDEVETFKTSNFKIMAIELKEHVKKIEKAIDANPNCDDELLKLYNYSMLDDHNKVIDYLLFITMIIDGRNTIDEYNMYNIINQSIDNVDDADFLYNGIDMEDYFDDSDDTEIKVLNDPTIEEKKEESTEKEELEEASSTNLDKEWLKDIGIND